MGPGIPQVLFSYMILAKLSKIKLLLLVGLKFLSGLSEMSLVLTLFTKKYIYLCKR